MARVASALLCDAATVREGLLHILGGGITRLHRAEFPAPMQVTLVAQVVLTPTEIQFAHDVTAVIQTEDGDVVVQANGHLEAGQPNPLLEPGESVILPLVINLHNVVVPAPGGYSIEISVDEVHQTSLTFRAVAAAI
ncbi:MAG TPA: hypothetical protein VHC63_09340 [Acidimicrobiales bacterium]|nr:hypothetical protein [Acidimicrobiales bacterium]